MTPLLVQLAIGLTSLVAGIVVGWWLRGDQQQKAPHADSQTTRAMEALANLHELACRMADDVERHTDNVQEINDELEAVKEPDPAAIAAFMTRLIENNQQMESDLQRAHRRLAEQAHELESRSAEARTDSLTGLPNRRIFDQELRQGRLALQQSGAPFALLLLDVDEFKRFNDTYGHQAGDSVLRGVARVLRETVRPDYIVTRYGGEEFAVLCPGATSAQARSTAELARSAVARSRFDYQGKTLAVTISCGMAQLLAEETEQNLLRRADEALYASKKTGRNCGHGHDGRDIYPLAAKGERDWTADESAGASQTAHESAIPQRWAAEVKLAVSAPQAFQDGVERRLAEFRRGGARISLILLKIDHLDALVKQQGRQAGDLALRSTAQFLKASMRSMDHLGRYNHDTIGLLLPTATLHEASQVADRLCRTLSRCKLPFQGSTLQLTASAGVAECAAGDDYQQLLDRALAACQRAGHEGGNRVCLQEAQPSQDQAIRFQV